MKTQNTWKEMRFCLALVMVAVWGGKPLTAQAGVPGKPVCLEQAAKKIRPEDKITLVLRDREKIKGRLVSIDTGQMSLQMTTLYQVNPTPSVYHVSDIKKIEYNGGGKLKRMALGLLIGGGIGALLGLADESSTTSSSDLIEVPASAVLGTLGGIVGLSIGLALPSTRVIECK